MVKNFHLQKTTTSTEPAKNEGEKNYLLKDINHNRAFDGFIGACPAFKSMIRKIEMVAQTGSTVLILGETGTGKELVARAIHELSLRRTGNMVKINCAALPPSLIESELFGHERGAFTGAFERKLGLFELANGGTIFLDEIGELPNELQAKLLRVLQDGEFIRLGGVKIIKTNVRIIAATNRDLQQRIDRGEFRSDLYYRLQVFPIHTPPLRERKEDIPLLINHLLDKYCRKMGREVLQISGYDLKKFMAYDWPGNIRELENVIERSLILSEGKEFQSDGFFNSKPLKEKEISPCSLEEVEIRHIKSMLELSDWKVAGKNSASEILKVNASTLRSKMRKLGIRRH